MLKTLIIALIIPNKVTSPFDHHSLICFTSKKHGLHTKIFSRFLLDQLMAIKNYRTYSAISQAIFTQIHTEFIIWERCMTP